jgi:DNA/RNA-binding domain of Phe-tRNA-synthetase-like protein
LKKIIVQDAIFDTFPEFYRGLVIVKDITNHPSLKRIRKLLKKAIDEQAAIDLDKDPRLQSWHDAHLAFGSRPNRYPPSIKSLLKRIKTNPALPFINSVVALFNYISIKYCLPCGGDDVDTVSGDLILGYADGSETFLPLGGEKTELSLPGEVIYFDSSTKNVMCRRWNWRNGDSTKIETTTRRIVINIDCLPPVSRETARQARDELAQLLIEHCSATLTTGEMHVGVREFHLDI